MTPVGYRCLRLTYWVRKGCFMGRQWLGRQFTPTGLGVLAIAMLSALVGLGSSNSLCHLIFLLSVALLTVSAIATRFIHYRFQATRMLPGFGIIGEPLQYQVIVHNPTPHLQPGLQLVESFSSYFPSFKDFQRIRRHQSRWRGQWCKYVSQRQWAVSHPQDLPVLPARTKTKATGEILPLRRGHLTFDTLTLACRDPLGLLYRRRSYHLPQSVCILPKQYQLPPLKASCPQRHPSGDAAVAAFTGDAFEFRSLRDYRSGDPMNKIHWKSWAKVGRPVVKEQQEESAQHHALILDTFQPEAHSAVFEEAISVAVSILAQEQTDEVQLDVIFTDDEARCFTVGRSLRQREQVMAALATLSPCQTQGFDALAPIIQARFPHLSHCLCILIDLDETRHAFLETLIQTDVPLKVIALCDRTTDEEEGFGYLLASRCELHFISIDQIQQDLLQI
ncbi:MAG: DUF58 domain-containing protein [Thermosynechococcaceae cyanobacterium]